MPQSPTTFDKAVTWGQRLNAMWSVWTSAWFKAFVLPVLVTLATGASGILGGIPLMWVLMASALAFMAVTHTAVKVYEIRQHIDPTNKLIYVQTVLNLDLKGSKALPVTPGGSTGKPRKLDKLQIGVELHNRSNYPMSVILLSGETSVERKSPPRSVYPKAASIIGPGAIFRVHDDPIFMDGLECGKRLVGTMRFKVKYGLQGDEDDELNLEATLDISISTSGQFEFMYTHWVATATPQGQANYGVV
jgi:hypothetical protein